MGLHYSPVRVYADVDAGSVSDFLADLEAKLTSVDWTSTGIKALRQLTFNTILNNDDITVDGQTYVFKTTLTPAANEVLIGADTTESAANLAHAINDDSGEGTLYGTGTTANATCEASAAGNVITISYKTAGETGNGFSITHNLEDISPAASSQVGILGGYDLLSDRTEHGLQFRIKVQWDNAVDSDYVRIRVYDVFEEHESHDYYIETAPGRLLKISGCPYQFFLWLPGAASAGRYNFCCGVPWIREPQRAQKITAVANNGSGEFRVTTAGNHGLATGANVYGAGGTKSGGTEFTALNGPRVITVIDATHYDLDGSTFESGYDADSAYFGDSGRHVVRAIWADGCQGSSTNNFRHQTSPVSGGGTGILQSMWANSYFHNVTTGTALELAQVKGQAQATNSSGYRAFGGFPDFLEARIGWPITAAGADREWVGDLWDACVFQDDVDKDVESLAIDVSTVDGEDWVNYMDNSQSALLLRISA